MMKTVLALIYPGTGAFICGALIFGCATALPKGTIPPSGAYVETTDLRAGGFRRTYRLHVPTGYKEEITRPLVVVIHSAFSTAREMEKQFGFSKLADRKGFIVVYPEGMGGFGFLQHWSAGYCCGKASSFSTCFIFTQFILHYQSCRCVWITMTQLKDVNLIART